MLYADCNSTTPLFDSVWKKMRPFVEGEFGNPSSTSHSLGRRAKAALSEARELVASLVSCRPEEVVFTSGGTESIFHALLGACVSLGPRPKILLSSVEHPAVEETVKFIEKFYQAQVRRVAVDRNGYFQMEQFEELLSGGPALVSVMYANNETGSVLPIRRIVDKARAFSCLVHSDCVQAVGKAELRFEELGVDFMSISAHKFGGPKGVGALIIRAGSSFLPVVRGGGQEGGRRGGTESVPLIVGMGEAARRCMLELQNAAIDRMAEVRDCFERKLQSELSGAFFTTSQGPRLPNTSHVMIENTLGMETVSSLAERDIVVSAGSACKSTTMEPSRVLTEMGFRSLESFSALRVSFGLHSTVAEAVRTAESITEVVSEARSRHVSGLANAKGDRRRE